MYNSLNLDSIYKNIATFGNMYVKHRVNIFSKDRNGNPVDYKHKFTSTKSKGGVIGFPSIAFRGTNDAVIIETMPKDKEDVKVRNSVYLSYNDIGELRRIFTESKSWFSKYKNDLFKYENNIPYGLNDKYNGLYTIMKLKIGIQGAFLSVQPVVICDALNNIGYPGVILKSVTGVLGSCTLTEYLSMQVVVVNLLENLYSNSNELITQYLLTEIIEGGKS